MGHLFVPVPTFKQRLPDLAKLASVAPEAATVDLAAEAEKVTAPRTKAQKKTSQKQPARKQLAAMEKKNAPRKKASRVQAASPRLAPPNNSSARTFGA